MELSNKRILFYCQVPFLDVNLEFLTLIKEQYEVHVMIELPETQLNSNILSLSVDLEECDLITSYESVKEKWNIEYLDKFFLGCASVNFVIYKPSFNFLSLVRASLQIKRYINSFHFQYIHFDDFSTRQALFVPLLKRTSEVLCNIHDPKPHLGEFEWKRALIKRFLFPRVSKFVVFSENSRDELIKLVPSKSLVLKFNLLPYSVYKSLSDENKGLNKEKKWVSFIGRLSPYKGLDIFIASIPEVLNVFPDQQFLIAGRLIKNYQPDLDKLKGYQRNVKLVVRHLTNEELVESIKTSKMLVCPYLESTQSGVVMTSYALNCPVIASNNGGLPEYVSDGITGKIVYNLNPVDLSRSIIEILRDDKFEELSNNIVDSQFFNQLKGENIETIKRLYS